MSDPAYVCADHFDDEYLVTYVQGEIGRLGTERPACTICFASGTVCLGVDLDPIVDMVESGLRRFYVEGDGWWDGPIDTGDVLYNLGGLADEVSELIVPQIGLNDWVPAGLSGHDEVEALSLGWESFDHHVRHVSRYLLDPGRGRRPFDTGPWLSPEEVLPAIAETIRAEVDLVTEIEEGAEIFRARAFNSGEPFTELHELVAPPPEAASQGRMNAAGIAVLYAALEEATAVAEVYNGKTSAAVITLRPLRDLTVLDLTSIASLSPYDPSVDARRFSMLGFLRSFARTIAKPIIRDDRVHHEYAPTQMASEFFHWRLLPGGDALDGIIYPSARGDGRNLVLFVGQEECLANEYPKGGQDRSPGCRQLLATDPIARVKHYQPPQASAGGVLRLVSEADTRTVF